jgi:hypothetical protein
VAEASLRFRTRASLGDDLRRLGVRPGDIVMVMSRLSTRRTLGPRGTTAWSARGVDHSRSSSELRLRRRLAARKARSGTGQDPDDRSTPRHHDPAPPRRASGAHPRQANPALRCAVRQLAGHTVAHGRGVRTSLPIVSGLPEDYFASIVEDFLATGRGVQGFVGDAPATMFEAAAMTAFAVAWLEDCFDGGSL